MSQTFKQPPAIFLMGPTASGKTGAAVELFQSLPVELISVDSALVFRDMDIGTAKPDAETLARAPHHLIDLISPLEAYSAAQFRADALQLMAEITARGKVPLLVGGTMLYFKALESGLSDLPEADPAIRVELDAEAAEQGWPAMHAKLAEVDPITAARLQPGDSQRVQRALEIWRLTGEPMSTHLARQTSEPLPYQLTKLALIPSDRAVLHQRIADRFDQMLDQNFLGEMRRLQATYPGLHLDLPSMRCVGYRQAWEHLAGETNYATFRDKGIFATRQLAKRQMTWLRAMSDTIVLDCLVPDLVKQVAQHVKQAISL
ncbi:tRNA (adenosine(37)-N6)-dimethylallyltransferase MiaA [Chitinivorax sp. B]|uniref:tRNA (adenosine(37)-N6)-dimethylallyltransferase MiaA n=1 Tax=Chitinivorax sp. B TaxID=2502235 RepID=UPI0010F8EE21|nr:tRNA (adenosine(37)-N6)-dimethylallyltransferase MiaA [Chitinivorax sp. B]